ncbi:MULTISPECIES: DivIVA domain-containing protein [Glycomyces]|uniref:DivIVA domain-containing protein n=2 Tax=Glycomyces TaxID=58113 RepID=A0A9X3PIJ1_9ACTN|nr:DivIVA domain-containing protein [Glycomyces lechevalierae]MDA1384710.1 DivIVA domain-containing protein [Glycomyces lechevalierae]MDR7337837.1 DivIVA domain-containing protein [Glycomyces lechevalierae]
MGFVLPIVVAVIGVWIAFSIVVWATGRDTLLDTGAAGAPLGLGEGEAVDERAVASVKFDTGLRGYRTDQVDAALNRLAWEIGRRDELLAEMQARLEGDTAELPAQEPAETASDEAAPLAAESDEEAALRLANEDEAAGPDDRADAAGSEAGREDEGETAPRSDT